MLVVVCLISNYLSTVVLEALGDKAHHLHLDIHHKVQLLKDLHLFPHRAAPGHIVPLVLHIAIFKSLDPVVVHPYVLQVLPLLLIQLNELKLGGGTHSNASNCLGSI